MIGYRLLLIDDDQTQHLILGEYLKLSGYIVSYAENGVEGLEKMESDKPDLVLLDVQMPKMDGFQTLERIRNHEELWSIPVLMLTSLDRQHLKIKGLEHGADDYITKPFDKAEVLARIKAVIRRSERFRRIEGMMAGNLSDVGLADLLQSMELGTKTAAIILKDMNAEVYIRSGMLVHARMGRFTENQALTRVFLLEHGAFSVQFNSLPEGIPDDPRPLMSVLMGVLAEVDEVRDLLKRMNVQNPMVKLKDDLSEFPELEKYRDKSPLPFMDLLISMEGNVQENLKTLALASKQRKLKAVK